MIKIQDYGSKAPPKKRGIFHIKNIHGNSQLTIYMKLLNSDWLRAVQSYLNTGCIKKGIIQLRHVIVHYILRLSIYPKIKNSQIRSDLKMPVEITFFHRWRCELHVN